MLPLSVLEKLSKKAEQQALRHSGLQPQLKLLEQIFLSVIHVTALKSEFIYI
jgi:hypothetical protein